MINNINFHWVLVLSISTGIIFKQFRFHIFIYKYYEISKHQLKEQNINFFNLLPLCCQERLNPSNMAKEIFVLMFRCKDENYEWCVLSFKAKFSVRKYPFQWLLSGYPFRKVKLFPVNVRFWSDVWEDQFRPYRLWVYYIPLELMWTT